MTDTLTAKWNETQQAGRQMWDYEPGAPIEDDEAPQLETPAELPEPYDARPTPGALTIEEETALARFQTRQAPSPADAWRARKPAREADRYSDDDLQALADYYAPGYRVA